MAILVVNMGADLSEWKRGIEAAETGINITNFTVRYYWHPSLWMRVLIWLKREFAPYEHDYFPRLKQA